MKYVPFTLQIELFPVEPGKRSENTRELQTISRLVYTALSSITTINLAMPGSGQEASFGQFDSYTNGLSITPQFGEQPPKLMITAFNLVTTDAISEQPEPQMTIISNGTTWTGYGGQHHWDSLPSTTTETEVKNLKTTLESAINASLPAVYDYKILAINYNGIKWGDRGFHFPK
jgi:hypothetical protein